MKNVVSYSYKTTTGKIFVLAHFGGYFGHFQPFSGLFRAQNHVVFSCCHPREGLTGFRERMFLPVFDARFLLKKSVFLCRKALPRSPRGRFESTTAAPLHRRKALVAEPGGPYGMVVPVSRKNGGNVLACKRLWMRVLQNV